MSSPHWAHLAGWRGWDLPPGRRRAIVTPCSRKLPAHGRRYGSRKNSWRRGTGGTRGRERRSSRMLAALQKENSEKGTRKHPRTAATGGSPAFSQLRERQTSNLDSTISACGRASKRRRGSDGATAKMTPDTRCRLAAPAFLPRILVQPRHENKEYANIQVKIKGLNGGGMPSIWLEPPDVSAHIGLSLPWRTT